MRRDDEVRVRSDGRKTRLHASNDSRNDNKHNRTADPHELRTIIGASRRVARHIAARKS